MRGKGPISLSCIISHSFGGCLQQRNRRKLSERGTRPARLGDPDGARSHRQIALHQLPGGGWDPSLGPHLFFVLPKATARRSVGRDQRVRRPRRQRYSRRKTGTGRGLAQSSRGFGCGVASRRRFARPLKGPSATISSPSATAGSAPRSQPRRKARLSPTAATGGGVQTKMPGMVAKKPSCLDCTSPDSERGVQRVGTAVELAALWREPLQRGRACGRPARSRNRCSFMAPAAKRRDIPSQCVLPLACSRGFNEVLTIL